MPESPEIPFYFNAIFHGPFVFVFYDKRVEVLGTDVKEHIVGAGTFGKERPCPPGAYSVTGLSSGDTPRTSIDRTMHAILDASKAGFQIASDSYYKFVLPMPSFMTALGRLKPYDDNGNFDHMFIGNDADKVTHPQKFGSVHALSYKIAKDAYQIIEEPLQLENLAWAPSTTVIDAKVQSINLHIFAESPYLLDLLHPNRDFAGMVAMLPGLSLGVTKPFPEIKFDVHDGNADALKYGISSYEQYGLRGGPVGEPLHPPLICDSVSLVVTNAVDTVP